MFDLYEEVNDKHYRWLKNAIEDTGLKRKEILQSIEENIEVKGFKFKYEGDLNGKVNEV